MQKEHVVHPLNPIKDKESRVLILGSFPSPVSRKKSFYYANKNNRFWRVLIQVFEDDTSDYETFCHKHHIALWDVIHSCTIKGASDASIDDVVVNDIAGLIKDTNIRTIFTTGKKASSLFETYIHMDIEHICLPSTSSANARMSLSDLVKYYRVIREKIDEEN